MADPRTPKQETLEALAQVHITLSGVGELSPVQRTIMRGLVEYAQEQVALVQELKIKRRTRKEIPNG